LLQIFYGRDVSLPSSTLHDLNGLIVLLIFFSLMGQGTPIRNNWIHIPPGPPRAILQDGTRLIRAPKPG